MGTSFAKNDEVIHKHNQHERFTFNYDKYMISYAINKLARSLVDVKPPNSGSIDIYKEHQTTYS